MSDLAFTRAQWLEIQKMEPEARRNYIDVCEDKAKTGTDHCIHCGQSFQRREMTLITTYVDPHVQTEGGKTKVRACNPCYASHYPDNQERE